MQWTSVGATPAEGSKIREKGRGGLRRSGRPVSSPDPPGDPPVGILTSMIAVPIQLPV